jgi:Ser/Thr protein kinase RdoA (MazF antagonist)
MNNLGEPIAVGRTAEIYSYGERKVLKLFLSETPQSWIEKEIEIGRYIQDTKLPVPKVYEIINIEEREGVIYERIEGPSLLNELATKPWNVVKYGRLLAQLHAQVHEVTAPNSLETQREWATGGIPDSEKMSADMKGSILKLLDMLPDGNQICHGDFHPGNIITTQRGPVIIDWMTVSQGVDIGDVARTSIILETAKAPEGTPLQWLLEWIRKLFLKTYLTTYFELRPTVKGSLAAWQAIMAANFLADVSVPGEEAGLRRIIEHRLTQ